MSAIAAERRGSAELHILTGAAPSSPKSPSVEQRTRHVVEQLELGSGPHKSIFTSPERPSRKSMFASPPKSSPPKKEVSPRTKLAAQLQSQDLSLGGASEETTREKIKAMHGVLKIFSQKQEKQPIPISIKSTSLSETARPCTRSESRKKQKEALSQLINGCEAQFFECAKANSSKRATVTFAEFKPSFLIFKDLLLSIESTEFLDHYIVRNSRVGANKDLEQQKSLEEFHAKIFELRDALNLIGILSLEAGKSVNFWSGREGQQRAADDPCSFSDSDIPLLKFLFDCWGYIKNREIMRDRPDPFLTSMLPNLFSAIFASYAKGEVNVYMSSKNDPSANSSIINIDSAFWGAELYHLTNNENVTKVNLYLHISGDAWAPPIDLKSTDPKVVAYKNSIIHISKRGDASLQVAAEALKNIGEIWKKRAIKDKLLDESDC